jgi:hypothetical protein
MKWLEEAGVDFFDISGGTYESPAWRGNIMTELAERPSQKERGSYFIEWAQEMKKILVRKHECCPHILIYSRIGDMILTVKSREQ